MRRLARLRRAADMLRDDSGNITSIALMLTVLIMTTVLPLVWNGGAIFVARRQSQNSSDAAALAAAQSVAQSLNSASQDWWGCIPPQTPTLIVEAYKAAVVMPIGSAGGGSGAAAQYAAANRAELTGYRQAIAPMGPDGVHAQLVSGATVWPIRLTVHGQAGVRGSIVPSFYHLDGTPVKAWASAEAYLARVRTWQTPCPAAPDKAIAQHYQFTWKTRLIKTDS